MQANGYQKNGKRRSFDQKAEQLKYLALSKNEVAVSEILLLMGSSAHYFLSALLMLPFFQPLPLPGFSSLLGIIVMASAICIIMNKNLWMPKKIKKQQISSQFILKAINLWFRFKGACAKYVKPRGKFVVREPLVRRLNGVLILISALLFSLPFPIPGTNTFPALTIFALSFGSIEDDGLIVGIGYLLFIATLAFFLLVLFRPMYHFFL